MKSSLNLSEVAFQTAKSGDIEPVLAMLSAGADPNTLDKQGFTALARAAQFDCYEMVRALLDVGTDVNYSGSKWGLTPLMVARGGKVTQALLEAGAEIDARSVGNIRTRTFEAGRTALMIAVERGFVEVVRVLLAYGADTSPRDPQGRNALMTAVILERTDILHALLEAGAEVGLIEAALLGDIGLVHNFLEAGADLDSERLDNALWWAAGSGQTEVILLLSTKGANSNAANRKGMTALMHAVNWGHQETVRTLLERGADVNATDNRGATALFYSIESGRVRNIEIIQNLLAAGADVKVANKSGWTALLSAALLGKVEVAELLLQRGADPNTQTMMTDEVSSSNALLFAIGNGHVNVVRALLQHGADVHQKNSVGTSALASAKRLMSRGHKQAEIREIISLLEAAGAEE